MAGGHSEGHGKVVTILKWIFILFIVALVLFWLVTGGPQKAWEVGKHFTNPVSIIFDNGTSTGNFIRLPWQPPELTRGPDISGYVGVADEQKQDADSAPSLDTLSAGKAAQLRKFGTPSPYAGAVVLSDKNSASVASKEYVVVTASADNTTQIGISGWSLESASHGVHIVLPGAAPVFVAGVVNPTAAVFLSPGASAIVSSGLSPLGVSLRENECSGYLEEMQRFTPALANSCPSAADVLEETDQNLRVYGSSCFEYLSNAPACYFPKTLPNSLSPACRELIVTSLSYNGCVQRYHNDASFNLPSWRLFLGSGVPLWDPSHDIIRLLDQYGRVVDVLVY